MMIVSSLNFGSGKEIDMGRLVVYSMITAASIVMTATFADQVGDLIIDLFSRVENSFP